MSCKGFRWAEVVYKARFRGHLGVRSRLPHEHLSPSTTEKSNDMDDDTQVGIAPDAITLCGLAWGDETPTVDYSTNRRPMPLALTGLLVAVLLSAIGIAAYAIVSKQPLRVAAPSTTMVTPPAVTASVAPPTITMTAAAPTITETETATPAAAPPTHHAPAQPRSPDDAYLAEVRGDLQSHGGLVMTHPDRAILRGHEACSRLMAPDRPTTSQVADEQVATRYPNDPWWFCFAIAVDAQTNYCPESL